HCSNRALLEDRVAAQADPDQRREQDQPGEIPDQPVDPRPSAESGPEVLINLPPEPRLERVPERATACSTSDFFEERGSAGHVAIELKIPEVKPTAGDEDGSGGDSGRG